MNLFLDDIRDPEKFGIFGFHWAHTADEAIQMFRRGDVRFASLDHDLTIEQMEIGGYNGIICDDGVKSGYDVILWLEQNPEFWPENGTYVHSQNISGRKRMEQAIMKHYGRVFTFNDFPPHQKA